MPFDIKAFMKAEFEPRTEEVRVPKLQQWFGEDEPIFKVKGLSAEEYVRIQSVKIRHSNAETIAKALANNAETLEVLREVVGLVQADTPEDLAKRLEMLVVGCVSPTIDMSAAIKLADCFIIDFYVITNTILELTGIGMNPKKSQTSGETAKSE